VVDDILDCTQTSEQLVNLTPWTLNSGPLYS